MKTKLLPLVVVVSFLAGALFQKEIGVGRLKVVVGLAKPPSTVRLDPGEMPELAHRRDALQALEQPGAMDLVFVGDSLVALQEWDEALRRPVLNRGISGARARDLIGRPEYEHANRVVLLVGVNDLLRGACAESFAADYQALLATVPANVAVLAISVPDISSGWARVDTRRIEEFNAIVRSLVESRGGLFVDIYGISQRPGFFGSDNIHLSAAGYRAVIAELKRTLG